MTFNKTNVQRIKNAFENISTSKWEAGDAALAEIPMVIVNDGNDHGVKSTLVELAKEAGVNYESLREYRDVAAAWDRTARAVGVSWAVHRECRGREDRATLIQNTLAEHGKVTVTLIRQAMGKPPVQNGKEAITEAAEEAAAKATAEAEAKAAKSLADALAKQKREADAAEAKRAKEAAAKIRAEEQAKAAEATRKERAEAKARIAELEQAAANVAKSNNFDISQLTDQQKFEIMTILQNDPDQAASWFKARDIERKRKAEYVEKQRKEQSAKREQDKLNKEKQEAIQRNRKDYEASPLYFFLNKVMPVVEELNTMLNTKQTNMDHLITSRMTTQDVISQTESGEATMERMREAIYILNATLAMENLAE